MFGRKRNWRFAKWLSGLDFFIIKSSSEKLPDNFVDLHTVMLPMSGSPSRVGDTPRGLRPLGVSPPRSVDPFTLRG